jgi:hypothetical protein
MEACQGFRHEEHVRMAGGNWNYWADDHNHPFLMPKDKVESTDKNNEISVISWSTTAYKQPPSRTQKATAVRLGPNPQAILVQHSPPRFRHRRSPFPNSIIHGYDHP